MNAAPTDPIPNTCNDMAQQKGTSRKPLDNGAASGEPERLPAYFLSLSLENVRCFGPKQTLDLSDGNGKPAPWTIILGLNGTGKTTILQSLVGFESVRHNAIAGNLEWPRFYAIPFGVESFSREPKLQAKISVECAAIPDLKATSSFSVDLILTHGGRRGDGVNFRYGHPTASYAPASYPRCIAYGAGRRVGLASLSEAGDDDPTATLFSDVAALRNPEEWLLQLDYAAAKAPKDEDSQHRLAQTKELLLSVLPDIEDIRLTTVSGPNPKPRAEFKTSYGWVPLRQLGYGYQTLITWVADLANRMTERYPESANPLAEPAVVLVDEIDLHLHPKWQRKLMGFLTERFPNTQFIATAHSPLVAQAAADANLAVLRREGDHVVIDNEVDNIRNWRIDQILTSDLFGLETARPPQVEALLLERKALLTKPKQTVADKRRLTELNTQIGELPMGETTKEIEERQKILSLLESLAKERKPAP